MDRGTPSDSRQESSPAPLSPDSQPGTDYWGIGEENWLTPSDPWQGWVLAPSHASHGSSTAPNYVEEEYGNPVIPQNTAGALLHP
jgi:hypothetical protein